MPKQGGFKRAVRERARATGERYTQARAAMDKVGSPVFDVGFRGHAALKEHLEARYGTRITSLAPITVSGMSYSCTCRVEREDGPAWVARIFPSAAVTVDRVQGDAEILRYLASHGFPAERLAHDEAVSVMDGSAVMVTDFVEGGRSTDDPKSNTPATWQELASLLGRLHTLPDAGGAVSRDGGSMTLHNGVLYAGRPRETLAAAMALLVSVEDAVTPQGRETFELLRDRVENADDADGLPEALTHHNYHGWAAVGPPGKLVTVGWAGAGRGERLAALSLLLGTVAHDPEAGDYIDAVVRGYREHVQLTAQEQQRLPDVINMWPLFMSCLTYTRYVKAGHMPTLQEPGFGWRPEDGTRIAERAIAALKA